MTKKINNRLQRRSTRFSEDGCTVFVRLRVDRRAYAFAKGWAEFHARADPTGTAEDQLEAHLGQALWSAMIEIGWVAPPDIQALFPKPGAGGNDLDDGIPL